MSEAIDYKRYHLYHNIKSVMEKEWDNVRDKELSQVIDIFAEKISGALLGRKSEKDKFDDWREKIKQESAVKNLAGVCFIDKKDQVGEDFKTERKK